MWLDTCAWSGFIVGFWVIVMSKVISEHTSCLCFKNVEVIDLAKINKSRPIVYCPNMTRSTSTNVNYLV